MFHVEQSKKIYLEENHKIVKIRRATKDAMTEKSKELLSSIMRK